MPMPIKYKLRRGRPGQLDKFALFGERHFAGSIYVDCVGENISAKTRILTPANVCLGYYAPTARYYQSEFELPSLRFSNVDDVSIIRRIDTKECLLVLENQDFHFSLYMKNSPDRTDTNCELTDVSGIISTREIHPEEELKCFIDEAIWERVDPLSLPQVQKQILETEKREIERNSKKLLRNTRKKDMIPRPTAIKTRLQLTPATTTEPKFAHPDTPIPIATPNPTPILSSTTASTSPPMLADDWLNQPPIHHENNGLMTNNFSIINNRLQDTFIPLPPPNPPTTQADDDFIGSLLNEKALRDALSPIPDYDLDAPMTLVDSPILHQSIDPYPFTLDDLCIPPMTRTDTIENHLFDLDGYGLTL